MTNASSTESTHGRMKPSPKKMLAIALAAGSVALPLAGCGNKATNAAPNPTATKTELASPSTPASIEASPSPNNPLDYYDAMQKYETMGIDTFKALPRDEQLQVAQYLIDVTTSSGEYDVLYEGKAHEYKVKPTPVSIDNSGQEILDDSTYHRQMAYINIGESSQEPSYHTSDGLKILSSVYYFVGQEGIITKDYSDNAAHMKTLKEPTWEANKWTATTTSGLLSGKDPLGRAIQYRIVTFHTQSGEVFKGKLVYHPFTSYDGTRQAVWLLYRFN